MNAVIFDMDGVLIDSEPFWQKAEKEIFSSLGVDLKDDLCKITQRMTTTEVTHFWFNRNPWRDKTIEDVENMVIDRVIELIESENCITPGVIEVIKQLKSKGLKLGLATNSPYKIIPRVLNKMNIAKDFDIISSAEFEEHGKPAPDIYLTTMRKLNEKADNCIVIEDSNSGIIAAKKAGIKVVAFKNDNKNVIAEKADIEIQTFENMDYSIFTSTV